MLKYVKDKLSFGTYKKNREIILSEIKKFKNREFRHSVNELDLEDEIDSLKELNKIPICCTTVGTYEELFLQTYFDVKELEFSITVEGLRVFAEEKTKFDTLNDAILFFKESTVKSVFSLKHKNVRNIYEMAVLAEISRYNRQLLKRNGYEAERIKKKSYSYYIDDKITKSEPQLFFIYDKKSGQLIHDYFLDPFQRYKVNPLEQYDIAQLRSLIVKYHNYRSSKGL